MFRHKRARPIRDELHGQGAQFDVRFLGPPLEKVEGLLLVDAVGEHQHALGVLDGPAGFGDLCDRLADLPVVVAATLSAVLRDRGHVDIEAMETDFCAGVVEEVLGEAAIFGRSSGCLCRITRSVVGVTLPGW